MQNEITSQPTRKARKNSRAKYKCPDELDELIKLANLVPPDVILPDWEKVFDEHTNYRFDDSREQRKEKFSLACQKTFDKCFEHFSEEVKRNVFYSFADDALTRNPDIDEKRLIEVTQFIAVTTWYAEVRQIRGDLRSLTNYFTHLRKVPKSEIGNPDFYGNGQDFKLPDLKVPLQINNTTIQVKLTGLAKAIDGVDGDRIRSCGVCSHIFWAKRRNAETCSPNCLNVLRQRRFREQNKEKVNARRRENYAYKKKLK